MTSKVAGRECSCLIRYVRECPRCLVAWSGCALCCGSGVVECEPDDMDAYIYHEDDCVAVNEDDEAAQWQ